MSKILIKTEYNWADEADFPSFCIVDEEDLTRMKARVEHFFYLCDQVSVCVGTNEDIEFNSYADVFGGWNYREIKLTQNEFEVVAKLFGDGYGECSLVKVLENIEYELDSMEEER